MKLLVVKYSLWFFCFTLIGCSTSNNNEQSTLNGVKTGDVCITCHGSKEGNAAPPRDLSGQSSTSTRGVGAHQSHLNESSISAAVPCNACHLVPTQPTDPGHLDSSEYAEVIFSSLAKHGGLQPVWDGQTCSNVYCHGATFTDGSNNTPIWTQVDGTQASCGTCHGNPPSSPHPQNSQCATCHSEVMASDGTFKNKSLHINGVVNLADSLSCNSCHGNGVNNAPSTGAHQTHMLGGDMRVSLDCSDCHQVPTSITSTGHIDSDLPAEITFGGLAKTGALSPIWNGNNCSNTYCHGSTLSGGTLVTPDWNITNGSQAACGTCHGLPPGPPHPTQTTCADCHSAVIDAGGTIIDKTLHINGKVDIDQNIACNTCHGNASNPAPPTSVSGLSSTALTGVGAHQSHLLASHSLSDPIACSECHIIPNNYQSAGHRDTSLPAEVTFGGLAKNGNLNPSWNGVTCNNTYCHVPNSADMYVGIVGQPNWTTVDGSQVVCGSCHGLPPETSTHFPYFDCYPCHSHTVFPDNLTFNNLSLHMNGQVDF